MSMKDLRNSCPTVEDLQSLSILHALNVNSGELILILQWCLPKMDITLPLKLFSKICAEYEEALKSLIYISNSCFYLPSPHSSSPPPIPSYYNDVPSPSKTL